jgi:hypothetical protein
MTSSVRMLALAAVLAGTFATGAQAQARSNTAGFNLGVFLNGTALDVEDADEIESGAGGSVHLGYGFNQSIQIFTRIGAASIEPEGGADSYTVAHVDLGARYTFGSEMSALRPFVLAAVTGRAASFDLGDDDTIDLRGPALTAGVGLGYFVSPSLAIEGGFSFSFGEFNEGRLNDDDWEDLEDEAIKANSTRFDLGLSWYP